MRMWHVLFCALIAVTVSPLFSWADSMVWIEGEDAEKADVYENAWFMSVDVDELAGGEWLVSFSESDQPSGTASYSFEVPEAAEYDFWLRMNPRGTGFDYRLDGGDWQTLDIAALKQQAKANRRNKDYRPKIRDERNIALDVGWDARFLAWVRAGKVKLAKGKHTLEVRLGGAKDKADKRFSALDCFVLTTETFAAKGKYRPGQKPENLIRFADRGPGVWDFKPETDAFSDESRLDLRSMNEAFAGEHGFIGRNAEGDFVRGDGKEIRFWGGSTYLQRNAWRGRRTTHEEAMAQLAHHARFLAKRGVNIVRLHGAMQPKEKDSKVTDVDQEAIDAAWRLVATMKKEGIYTIISPYWGSHTNFNPSWGVADPKNGRYSALLFFDKTLQKGYKNWLRVLYTNKNPYTGIPLAEDPAVATIQLQNEDSMLFWTMQSVRGEQYKRLTRLYGDWLVKKYGSLEKARKAWSGLKHGDDDFDNGRAGMYIVWEFSGDALKEKGRGGGRDQRLADQLEFMSKTMYDFNRMIGRFLREELGCKQLVNAGNWRTVDPVLVDDAERWSYTANDVIGKNHYYGATHLGFQRGWRIREGHYFTHASATMNPRRWPMNVKQVIGHPFIIPESLWVPPMLHQAEGPLMVAAQSCLTGFDTFYWFATGVPEWQPPLNKWTFATPMQMGQFPAASMIFRRAMLEQGPAVVHEERALRDIWHRKSPIIAEGAAFDPNRDEGNLPKDSAVKSPVTPLAFCVGRVEVKYGGDPANNRVMDLSKYIDEDGKKLRSITKQIELDWDKGLYIVDGPSVAAAAGFLKQAGTVETFYATFDLKNDYAAVTALALDDKLLGDSEQVLVQIGTTCRPVGWTVRPARFKPGEEMVDGFRIVDAGGDFWQIEQAAGTVTISNPGLSKATVLDVNGMAAGEAKVTRDGRKLTLHLPAEAMYVILE